MPLLQGVGDFCGRAVERKPIPEELRPVFDQPTEEELNTDRIFIGRVTHCNGVARFELDPKHCRH